MSSVQSAILGFLDDSSIPGIFKTIIRNMLPNMTRIQKDSILATLYQEYTKKKIVNIKRKRLFSKYSFVIEQLEKDHRLVPVPLSEIKKISKNKKASSATTKTTTSLSDLKKQVGR